MGTLLCCIPLESVATCKRTGLSEVDCAVCSGSEWVAEGLCVGAVMALGDARRVEEWFGVCRVLCEQTVIRWTSIEPGVRSAAVVSK